MTPNPHFALPKVSVQLDKERLLCFPNRSLKRLLDERKIDAMTDSQRLQALDYIIPCVWAGCLWEDKELPYETIENYILDNMGPFQLESLMESILFAITGKRAVKDEKADRPPEASQAEV